MGNLASLDAYGRGLREVSGRKVKFRNLSPLIGRHSCGFLFFVAFYSQFYFNVKITAQDHAFQVSCFDCQWKRERSVASASSVTFQHRVLVLSLIY